MAAHILFNWKRPQITKSQADTFMMRLKKTSLYSACVHWESRRCPPLCSLLPYIQTKHQHLQATSLCSSQVHLMLFLTFSLYLTSLLMLLGPKTLGLQLLWPCLSLAMTAMVISLQLRQRPIICILVSPLYLLGFILWGRCYRKKNAEMLLLCDDNKLFLLFKAL